MEDEILDPTKEVENDKIDELDEEDEELENDFYDDGRDF